MLKERNERCSDRCDLDRSHIHKLKLFGSHDREVGIKTRLNAGIDERTVIVDRSITLSNHLAFFNLGCEVNHIVIVQIHLAILHLAVGSLDEAEVVNLCIHAKRRDKTDVRTFRSLDRAKTAIVGVVYVSHLETCAFTGKTAGTKSRHTALVGDLSQRVGLVHELRKRIRTEEGIDHSRDSLGVDQVDRSEHLVITDVHLFTDRTRDTSKSDTELVI